MTHTGIRIRDKRLARGLSQMELAAAAGISASYLNLIEHNRRRITSEVLANIARVLQMDVSVLADGAAPDLLAGLKGVAEAARLSDADVAQIADFASRFPAWARLLVRLSEAADQSPKEVRDIVERIGGAAQSLIDSCDDPNAWPARLAQEIRQQASGLHVMLRQREVTQPLDPQGEADAWLNARGGHVAELEVGEAPQDIVERAQLSEAAAYILLSWLEIYAQDARHLPLARFTEAAQVAGWDPVRLTELLQEDPARVLRRLAAFPAIKGGPGFGLLVLDAAGNLLRNQAIDGVRFTSPLCPLLPVFDERRVWHGVLSFHDGPQVQVFVQSSPRQGNHWQEFPHDRIMLMRQADGALPVHRKVGPGCVQCRARNCPARRVPQENP